MNQREMQRGLAAKRRQDKRDAIKRVTVYKRWLRKGSKLIDIPEIPSDSDYEKWRESRRPRRPE